MVTKKKVLGTLYNQIRDFEKTFQKRYNVANKNPYYVLGFYFLWRWR